MTESNEAKVKKLLIKELSHYRPEQIETVLQLLAEGNTLPFIARYRKEKTGSLDEVQIFEISERFDYLATIEKRKTEVLRLIDEQEKLTAELAAKIKAATTQQQVEDLYRPYRQKRRTLATIAREKGLAPLADWLLTLPREGDLEQLAKDYLDPAEELETVADVLAGVHEILAEIIGDEPMYRQWIREFTQKNGAFVSQVKDEEKDEKKVYEMYYDFSEPISRIVSHRILAANRGEKEDILRITLDVPEEPIEAYLARQLIAEKTSSLAVPYIEAAYQDSYRRFIGPAIERELRNQLTEQADQQAIAIFGENLRNLLLQPPLKGKVVLGFDPAYRTGCKLAVVDETGKTLAVSVIYPHKPASARQRAAAGPEFLALLKKYQVEMIAIGNGTASRESELFVAEQLKTLEEEIFYVIVNEAGASVYSASPVARAEFPDLQVEERSAISIARRLQDPLAELVKIEPQAVGVGQYQHDVAQKELDQQLAFVVETAVNQVGVNVNTASPQLLQHVAGLNKTTAQNVVTYREENGAFTNRPQLKKVPRLGPKAYEQSIGFLRILDGKNKLDETGIHPETYPIVEKILKEVALAPTELGSAEAQAKLATLDSQRLTRELDVGLATLTDIIQALKQPGRDLRAEMPAPLLRRDVLSMEDLEVGMEFEGSVRNVVDFGAFVDIGVKEDGLVHISKLSQQFVKHPTDVVAVGDIVTVWVETLDLKKGRVGLSMIGPQNKKG